MGNKLHITPTPIAWKVLWLHIPVFPQHKKQRELTLPRQARGTPALSKHSEVVIGYSDIWPPRKNQQQETQRLTRFQDKLQWCSCSTCDRAGTEAMALQGEKGGAPGGAQIGPRGWGWCGLSCPRWDCLGPASPLATGSGTPVGLPTEHFPPACGVLNQGEGGLTSSSLTNAFLNNCNNFSFSWWFN